MRFFNPLSVWTQVTIANKTARVFKSVQYGTYTFGSGGTSTTATITSVDTTRAVVIPLGFTVAAVVSGAGGIGATNPYLTLTNATTITATRASGTDSAGTAMVGTGSFVVVEGY